MKNTFGFVLLFFLAMGPRPAAAGDAALDELASVLQALQQTSQTHRGEYSTPAGPSSTAPSAQAQATAKPSGGGVGSAHAAPSVRAQATAKPSAGGEGVSPAKAILQQSQADVSYLQRLSAGQTVPAQYSESLRLNTALLKNLDVNSLGTSEGLSRLEAVQADLQTKVNHAKALNQAAFKSIQVMVHTRKQGQEVKDYEVWYVPAAYSTDASRGRRFEKYSSPTSQPLAAGNYYFWAQATTGAKGNQQLFPIGEGSSRHEIDIAAP